MVIYSLHLVESKFRDSRVGNVNEETLNGRSEDIPVILKHRLLNKRCVQEISFKRKSVRQSVSVDRSLI